MTPQVARWDRRSRARESLRGGWRCRRGRGGSEGGGACGRSTVLAKCKFDFRCVTASRARARLGDLGIVWSHHEAGACGRTRRLGCSYWLIGVRDWRGQRRCERGSARCAKAQAGAIDRGARWASGAGSDRRAGRDRGSSINGRSAWCRPRRDAAEALTAFLTEGEVRRVFASARGATHRAYEWDITEANASRREREIGPKKNDSRRPARGLTRRLSKLLWNFNRWRRFAPGPTTLIHGLCIYFAFQCCAPQNALELCTVSAIGLRDWRVADIGAFSAHVLELPRSFVANAGAPG